MTSNILHVALVGHSNTGKTTLFNTLTGYQQKIANYGGVTVECKTGIMKTPSGRKLILTDLPGTYSLKPISPDEMITCKFCDPQYPQSKAIDIILCVLDATNLKLHLQFSLKVKQLNRPMLIVLNRMDIAQQRGIHINIDLLQTALNIPIIPTQARHQKGIGYLLDQLDQVVLNQQQQSDTIPPLKQLLQKTVSQTQLPTASLEDKIDRWVLHPWLGPIILGSLMFFIFQAIFSWAEPIKTLIEISITNFGWWATQLLPPDTALYSLINDGIFAGLGTICAFFPQILFLFAFIFILEESGYLPRAAFLFDYPLAKVGLTGRAFIPLLSSFACTIPSIIATRSIPNARDRLVTILVAPLITCSARLPIYTLLIAAFIPPMNIGGLFNLQGLVLFALYCLGIGSAFVVAWVIKHLKSNETESSLLMELPLYQLPQARSILLKLWNQLISFLSRVGTIILALTVLLWFLCRFPLPPAHARQPAIYYSAAGYIGRTLSVLFKPIGFDWHIVIALIPGLAAREVAISALATIYMMSGHESLSTHQLTTLISQQWSLPTAFSLLAWYVFAPQCLSTLTVIRRETHSWRYMFIAAGYLFGLAYLASFITFQIVRLW